MIFKKLLMLTAIITGFSFISDDCNCMNNSRNNQNNNRININSRNQHSNSNRYSRYSGNNSRRSDDFDAAPVPGKYDYNSNDEYIDGDLEAPMSIGAANNIKQKSITRYYQMLNKNKRYNNQ